MDGITLYQVATDPQHANYATARKYFQECNDTLALLSHFLRYASTPCMVELWTNLCSEEQCIERIVEDPVQEGTSLLQLCLYRPHALYAFNDAIIDMCRDQMPGVSAEVFGQLHLYNTLLRHCRYVPADVAVLIFWWLATAHRGIIAMVAELEPVSSVWKDPDNAEAMWQFCNNWIIMAKNHDTRYIYYYAAALRAALAYAILNSDVDLIRTDGQKHIEHVPKQIKPLLIAEHKQKREGRKKRTETSESIPISSKRHAT